MGDVDILSVPYMPQWGEDADERRGDCGPACNAMLVNYTTLKGPSVNEMAFACGQPTTSPGQFYTNHAQLRTGARAFGVTLQTRSKYSPPILDLPLLKSKVDQGKPSIVLVHYGVMRHETNHLDIVHNQDQKYDRGHWMLFVGYDGNDVILHDPDYWGARTQQGKFRQMPASAFVAALKAVAPGCTVGDQGLVVL
jgi:hypothetical protein